MSLSSTLTAVSFTSSGNCVVSFSKLISCVKIFLVYLDVYYILDFKKKIKNVSLDLLSNASPSIDLMLSPSNCKGE